MFSMPEFSFKRDDACDTKKDEQRSAKMGGFSFLFYPSVMDVIQGMISKEES